MFDRRLALLVTAVAVLAAALPACGDPQQESNASPLAAMFGEPESEAEMRAKQLQQEEAVAGCMKAEGWEYTPGYGEQHGYGIVYSFETYELPYLDADGNYAEDSPMNGREFEDPNADYVG